MPDAPPPPPPSNIDIQLPSLADLCVQVGGGPGQICIFMPGGATICASIGYEFGDPAEILAALLAQVNTALAPLTPFFDVLDLLVAIVNCIKAIPDSLGPPPNPQPIVDCLKGLAEALEKILGLIPPLSILKMIKSILLAIAAALLGIRNKIAAIADQAERILQAATAAAALGNLELAAIADCAQANQDLQLQNLNAQMLPLNRLIGLLNAFLQLAGLPCVPLVGDLVGDLVKPLDDAIAAIEAVADAIPVDLGLEPILGPPEC